MEEIKIEYHSTYRDAGKAFRNFAVSSNFGKSFLTYGFPLLFSIAFICSFIVSYKGYIWTLTNVGGYVTLEDVFKEALVSGLILGCLSYLAVLAILLVISNVQIKKYPPEYFGNFTVTMGPNSLSVYGPLTEIKYDWEMFDTVITTSDYLFFCYGSGALAVQKILVWIPIKALRGNDQLVKSITARIESSCRKASEKGKGFKAFQLIGFILATMSLALILFYFVFRFIRGWIPIQMYLDIIGKITVPVILAFLPLLLGVFLLRMRVVYKFAIAILMTMFVGFVFVVWDFGAAEHLLQTAQARDHQYFLSEQRSLFEPKRVYYIYQCNFQDFDCEMVFVTANWYSTKQASLLIGNNGTEVHFLRGDELEFTYGAQPWGVELTKPVDQSIYYLAYYYDTDKNEVEKYMLFECTVDLLTCQQLPFQYVGEPTLYPLEVDENTGEIRIYRHYWDIVNGVTNDLVFTYGDQPKCYVEGCTTQIK